MHNRNNGELNATSAVATGTPIETIAYTAPHKLTKFSANIHPIHRHPGHEDPDGGEQSPGANMVDPERGAATGEEKATVCRECQPYDWAKERPRRDAAQRSASGVVHDEIEPHINEKFNLWRALGMSFGILAKCFRVN